MMQLITIFILISYGHNFDVDQGTPDKNFRLIEDFQKDNGSFRTDEFDLAGQSTEGAQLVVFHHKDKTYLVVDIWMYGEMGKINATYWTDKKLNVLIVKRTDFAYDKPFYEENFKVTETTKYLSYHANKVIGYNSERKALAELQTTEMKTEYEAFFEDVTKGLKNSEVKEYRR